jgi:hypothetical protein
MADRVSNAGQPLQGWIEPHAGMLKVPEAGQSLYKIMLAEHLVQSFAHSYLHFNRVDAYRDFPRADAHDAEQLPADAPINAGISFEKAPTFTIGDYYARARARTYAFCLSLDNSAHIWREYANNGKHGKVGLVFNFGKLRARLNELLEPGNCLLQANGQLCHQLFSLNYGIVEYVDRTIHRENTTRLANPIRYAYLKDQQFAAEHELRVSLSAFGMGLFVMGDGSEMIFSDNLQMQFDYRAAFADGTIEQILVSPDTDIAFLRAELKNFNIIAVEG